MTHEDLTHLIEPLPAPLKTEADRTYQEEKDRLLKMIKLWNNYIAEIKDEIKEFEEKDTYSDIAIYEMKQEIKQHYADINRYEAKLAALENTK